MLTLPPPGGLLPKKILLVEGARSSAVELGPILERAFGIPFVPSGTPEAERRDALRAVLAKADLVALEGRAGARPSVEELSDLGQIVSLPTDALPTERSDFGEVAVRAILADLLERVGVGRKAVTPELRSSRLLLRGFRDEDREAFAEMNADARVMEHFPAPLSREASDAMVDRIRRHFDTYGFGLWAVEAPLRARFIGFIGLAVVGFAAPFAPAVEIGWRLAHAHWGRGYATEGARLALRHGFDSLDVRELVSFTSQSNLRSRKVMEAIGMTRDPSGDFDHPRVPAGHPARPHVLYRSSRKDARALRS